MRTSSTCTDAVTSASSAGAFPAFDFVVPAAGGPVKTLVKTALGISSRAEWSPDGKSIAYFSAEFALHQSLPIYAGGLGVLAGDHCKEASDLGVPLIGVGFVFLSGAFSGKSPTPGTPQVSGAENDHMLGTSPSSTPHCRPTPCRRARSRAS